MDYHQLLSKFFDGNLSIKDEQGLFRQLAKDKFLRSDMKQMTSLIVSGEYVKSESIPNEESKAKLFNKIGVAGVSGLLFWNRIGGLLTSKPAVAILSSVLSLLLAWGFMPKTIINSSDKNDSIASITQIKPEIERVTQIVHDTVYIKTPVYVNQTLSANSIQIQDHNRKEDYLSTEYKTSENLEVWGGDANVNYASADSASDWKSISDIPEPVKHNGTDYPILKNGNEITINEVLEDGKKSNNRFGVFIGGNKNIHYADFNKLKNIPNCCPEFREGEGSGYSVGLLHEYSLYDWLAIGNRIGVMGFDGLLSSEETTQIITEDGVEIGAFEHIIDASYLDLGYEPSLIFTPLKHVNFEFGLRFGTNLIAKYKQREMIKEPKTYGTFLDENGNDSHSRIRNDFSGDIPESIPLQMAVNGGISYDLPLNKDNNFLISLGLKYYHPLTEKVMNTSWKVSSISGGISAKFSPMSKEREYIYREKIDTVFIESDKISKRQFKSGMRYLDTIRDVNKNRLRITQFVTGTDTLILPKKYKLDVAVKTIVIDSLGNQIENPKFLVQEYVSNRLEPLLNYIFFNENQSVIPERYKTLNKEKCSNFEISSLQRESTVEINLNVLNIIGIRMLENPNAEIKLTGTNANVGHEKGNTNLSLNRAKSVKKYLVDIWNIDASRIKLHKRNLPKNASKPIKQVEKAEENRRVEITSSSPEILEPIFFEKFDRIIAPQLVKFIPYVNAEAGIASWNFEGNLSNVDFNKSGVESPKPFEWDFGNNSMNIPSKSGYLDCLLMVEDSKGNKKEANVCRFPIEVATVNDKRENVSSMSNIETFSLIVFGFEKTGIDRKNKQIIDFIKSRIKDNSKIEVIGYTDTLGKEEYNKYISEKRAESVKKLLGRKNITTKGYGESIEIYDNSSPEGRYLSRTVKIIVTTPAK
jgi:outer membrane protein OmpA-like peptidoglycan-associated protein